MVIWKLGTGRAVDVRGAVEGAGDSWTGRLHGAGQDVFEASPGATRKALAVQAWNLVQQGCITLPVADVARIRVHTDTVYTIVRDGENSGPEISFKANAEPMAGGWQIALYHPVLGGLTGTGTTFHEARENLVNTLLLACDVGIESVPADWSALRLIVSSHKSFRVEEL